MRRGAFGICKDVGHQALVFSLLPLSSLGLFSVSQSRFLENRQKEWSAENMSLGVR